jgi:hypothetical protein
VQVKVTLPEQLELTQARGRMNYRQGGNGVINFDPVTLPPGGEEIYEVRAKALRAAEVMFNVELMARQLTSGLPVRSQQRTTLHDDLRRPVTPAGAQQPQPAPGAAQ